MKSVIKITVLCFILLPFTQAVFANDNCGDVKSGINARFKNGACYFGGCGHPVPLNADAEALTFVVNLTKDGALKNLETGHKTVKNWWEANIFGNKAKGDLPNTYLSYACGDK